LIAKKVFLQPSRIVYWGIRDLMDAQNGREVFSDEARRTIYFTVKMFDAEWRLHFVAQPVDQGRCETSLEVVPETTDEESGIKTQDDNAVLADYVSRREYAMLDAMLLIGTPLEIKHAIGE
jgi:hypothetical protein